MKKTLLSLFATVAAISAAAQVVEVQSVDLVPVNADLKVNLARISPDGTFAIVSNNNNTALTRIDLKSGAARKVADNGSALELKFSPDSKAIIYKSSTTAQNKLRYHAIKSVELESGTVRNLTASLRHAGSFGLTTSGNFAVASEGKLMARNSRGISVKADNAYIVGIHHGHLMLTRPDGTTTAIDPQGKGSYLWPSISPDGTKIVYFMVGRGCYVCDLDGSNARSLGYIHAPAWLGNDIVIGCQDYDNGEYITSSTIVASNLNGTMQTLTDGKLLGLAPTASADGSKITFSSADGKLYVITLK